MHSLAKPPTCYKTKSDPKLLILLSLSPHGLRSKAEAPHLAGSFPPADLKRSILTPLESDPWGQRYKIPRYPKKSVWLGLPSSFNSSHLHRVTSHRYSWAAMMPKAGSTSLCKYTNQLSLLPSRGLLTGGPAALTALRLLAHMCTVMSTHPTLMQPPPIPQPTPPLPHLRHRH